MSSFEFKVAKNMSMTEGTAAGYFAVQSDYSGVGGAITRCLYGIDRISKAAKCIPIITDEFGAGNQISNFLSVHDEHAAFVTFGTDEEPLTNQVTPIRSHAEILSYEIGRIRPGFLSVILEMPKPMSSMDWRRSKPLDDINLHYDTVTVEGDDCLIEVDESIPPLA